MFTVLRKINGDRRPSEHETVVLGDTNSQIYKEAIRLLNTAIENDGNQDKAPGPVKQVTETDDEWATRFLVAYNGADNVGDEGLIALVKERYPTLVPYKRVKWFDSLADFKRYIWLDAVEEGFCFLSGFGIDDLSDLRHTDPNTLVRVLTIIAAGPVKIAVYCREGFTKYDVLAKPNRARKTTEVWAEKFNRAYHDSSNDQDLIDLVAAFCPGLFDPKNARWSTDFSLFEQAYVEQINKTILFRFNNQATAVASFQSIPTIVPSTGHKTLELICAEDVIIGVYNSQGLGTTHLDIELSDDPDKAMSELNDIKKSLSVQTCDREYSSVAELSFVHHDQKSVLKYTRDGSRSLADVIGVLAYTELKTDGTPDDDCAYTATVYEFIYQGDEVYITNRHGKTVDSIR